MSGQIRTGHNWSGQVRISQDRSVQDRSVKVRTGQPAQVNKGQNRLVQVGKRQDRTDQDVSGKVKTIQSPPKQQEILKSKTLFDFVKLCFNMFNFV